MWKPWNLCFLLLLSFPLSSQIQRIEPPNWWVGMQNEALQLLVQGDNIGNYRPSLIKCQECPYIKSFHKADSPNYLFLDLIIPSTTLINDFTISFSNPENNKSFQYQYELKSRESKPQEIMGFDSSDAIYLITPDRFANGNPKNDSVQELRETEVDRGHDYKRHGGDIRGIFDHLDYIHDMGFTAIWSSPLLENNMAEQSYHGYAITDFYKVDPRFGSLEEYVQLSDAAAQKGIKLIMDQVANHCGREHWWMKDLPFRDWVNFQEGFEKGSSTITTNHRRTVNQDSYASESDKDLMERGWFVPSMPDLNQSNPFMAQYIIQNSIWWIETLQLGGIRQDTYPYPNKAFMANWAKAIMDEYPNFNIVGEEWSYNPLLVGYWQQGSKNKDGYKSYLKSTMDFPLQKALVEALKEPESWDKGLIKLYEGLANDFIYPNPNSILLFGDNHDMDRLFTQLNEDVALTKMALAFILTAPRIPQIYYGTEILMENSSKPGDHGLIRTDFPGGWEGDVQNGFSGENLTSEQQEMQSYLRTLLNYRKTAATIHFGETKHFAPNDGIYVLFRYLGDEMVMLILNKNVDGTLLDLNRFSEMKIKGKTASNVIGRTSFTLEDTLHLKPKEALILSIKK